MAKALTFGIAISFISWMVGMILNALLVKSDHYEKLSNLNFIKSEALNKYLGLEYFIWIIQNSFFKFFNQKIKLKNKKADLNEIRREMTLAEISHLIAFVFVVIVAVYKTYTEGFLFGFIIMLVNILMNLYPSLLQQENKRRIDKLIQRRRKSGVNEA